MLALYEGLCNQTSKYVLHSYEAWSARSTYKYKCIANIVSVRSRRMTRKRLVREFEVTVTDIIQERSIETGTLQNAYSQANGTGLSMHHLPYEAFLALPRVTSRDATRQHVTTLRSGFADRHLCTCHLYVPVIYCSCMY